MITYILNNSEYTITTNQALKVGEVVKACDNVNVGKDGKPTLKLVKLDTLTKVNDMLFMGACTLQASQVTSNIIDYELCVFDMRKTDLVLATLSKQLSNEPNSIGVWEQSSGKFDDNGKAIKRRVYFVMPRNKQVSDIEITRIKGVYFNTYEEEKTYIEDLEKQGYYFK